MSSLAVAWWRLSTVYFSAHVVACSVRSHNSHSSIYLYPPGTGWPNYTPKHWIPLSGGITGVGLSVYNFGTDRTENTALTVPPLLLVNSLPLKRLYRAFTTQRVSFLVKLFCHIIITSVQGKSGQHEGRCECLRKAFIAHRPKFSPSAFHRFGGYPLTYGSNHSPSRRLATLIYSTHIFHVFFRNILAQGRADECVTRGRLGRYSDMEKNNTPL